MTTLRRQGLCMLILLVALALRLYQIDAQSIWWDEGHSILMAAAPWSQVATQPGMDVHPPGYFLMLKGWMGIAGRHEFALRYLSTWFSVLTVALIFRFGRDIRGRWAAIWAGSLAALSPFYIAYGQEVRMYALAILLATASSYALWRFIVLEKRAKALLVGYIVATGAILYSHYFAIFLLAFQNLAWLVWVIGGKQYKEFKPRAIVWGVSQFGVVLLFLPQLVFAVRQVGGYANPNLQPPPLMHYIGNTWQAFTLHLTIDPAIALPYLWLIASILVGGSIIFLARNHNNRLYRLSWLFLAGWLIIPLGLYFVVLQVRPSFEPRYLALATPPIFLLLGLIFGRMRWYYILFVLIIATTFIHGLHSYFTDEAFFKDDSVGVTAWLATETTPNDIIFVDVPHPFHYYAERIPAPANYLFVDVHTAADQLNQAAAGKDRLYWVTWWGSDTDPRGVIDYLARKQAGPPQGEQQFRGYRVVWYDLGDEPFSLPNDLTAIDVNFDNVFRLDGLSISPTASPAAPGWATLHFTQLAPTDVNYKVSLRLRTADGQVIAQVDRPLLNDRHFQTAAWPIHDPALNQAINVYPLDLNTADYQGAATLEAVLYNAADGAAIAAYGVPTTNEDFVSAQLGEMVIVE